MVRTILAYAATYLLWGSTFLGIRVAVQEMEPFAMAGSRFLLAGLIVLVLVKLRPKLADGNSMSWPKALLTGALFTVGTHGIISHVARTVPSGTIAVMMATVPLMAALLGWGLGEKRPSFGLAAGLILGMIGVMVLAAPGGALDIVAVIWLLIAAACWTVGSFLTQRWGADVAKVPMAGRQMFAGGALLMLASGISGQGWIPDWPGWATAAAVAYLALFGTILAYFSYLHLMSRASITKASSYTFVNPVVAVVLGATLGGELITARLLLATPFIVAAVVLTIFDKPRRNLHGSSQLHPNCQVGSC